MEPSSREFLLQEYSALWRYIEYLDATRNKAVALYLALLGATTGALLGAVQDWGGDVGLYKFLTIRLSSVLLFSALVFGLITSIAVLLLSIQFRSLFIEYVYSLNRIRRAFDLEDRTLRPFLVLPIRMLDVRTGTRGIAHDMHLFLSVVSASVVWVLVISVLYRMQFEGWLPPCVAATLSGSWVLASYTFYRRDVQKTLNNLWARCPQAVREEIAAEAHAIASKSAYDSWLEGERITRKRWGQGNQS